MGERKDLRSLIVPTKISNTDEHQRHGDGEFDTIDLIYLASREELSESGISRYEVVEATDYAIMKNFYGSYWLRSAESRQSIDTIRMNGNSDYSFCDSINMGLRPKLRFKITAGDTYDIQELDGSHMLRIGEYPSTKVIKEESQVLEELYNGGSLKQGMTTTGRWYTDNGAEYEDIYAGRHSPEFEYNGARYVRVISYPYDRGENYSDGTRAGDSGTVRWTKVEPISYKILNWNEMPQSINPNGNGKAEYFDLISESVITTLPFYTMYEDENSEMWQNSVVRGYLNGIDVRNIKENGNIDYTAENGGNFEGQCNFLNEAFNLEREPIVEYTIPESEKEICDNAFNGCVMLKKLTIHPNVKSIGKNAFDGCSFKYAYMLKSGHLILSEMPPEKEEYEQSVNIEKLRMVFGDFDYELLLRSAERVNCFI